ncbi:MAG: hypothetical protein ACO3B4_06220 [Burkholderiaceae bacterium]
MTFSRQLLRSLFLLLGLLALVLVLVVVSQRAVVQNASLVAQDVFVPATRVERLTVIARTLSVPLVSGSLASDVSFEQACTERQAQLLTGRVAAQLGLASAADARQRLGAAFSSAQAVAAVGCRGFLAEVDLVLRNPTLLSAGQAASLPSRITQTLTERVSWNSVPPCLYLEANGKPFYLRGPQGYCLATDGIRRPGLASQVSLPASVRQLGNLAYSRLLDPQSMSGSVADARRFAMTLHQDVSGQLDRYAGCWSAGSDCPIEGAVTPLSGTQGATVVVMDAQTGAVLGMQCFGAICASDRLFATEPLAPALIEAPPASAAKLFFSLALAEAAAPPKDLLLQIKTSGQLDPTAVKRNEWWERSAICDLQARPLGAAPHACTIADRAMRIAETLGWNSRCLDAPSRCGVVSLAPELAMLPGFMGLIQTVSASNTQDLGGATSPMPERRYLNWNDYNRIRVAGGVTQIGLPYREASAAVQSVLGAAEARTSALGLAGLASGLYRLSQGRPPSMPLVIKPLAASVSGASAQPARQAQSLAAAARLVRQGMAKVVSPAEPGWLGDGTAHRAFLASFGRPCSAGCPVEGKTGTVSARDPRFAGTTTFTGLVELPRLRGLLGLAMPSVNHLPPVLALGVIVFSADRSQPMAGHAASHLAMHLIRDISAPAIASPGQPGQPN